MPSRPHHQSASTNERGRPSGTSKQCPPILSLWVFQESPPAVTTRRIPPYFQLNKLHAGFVQITLLSRQKGFHLNVLEFYRRGSWGLERSCSKEAEGRLDERLLFSRFIWAQIQPSPLMSTCWQFFPFSIKWPALPKSVVAPIRSGVSLKAFLCLPPWQQ